MLEVKNLSIRIMDRYLVENLTFNLNKKDKLAIIGEEGNGKSTLLKAILGLCDYAEITGNINFKNNRIGYLKQTLDNEKIGEPVFDFLFDSKEEYYNLVSDLYKYLEELQLDDMILDPKVDTLSGGEKVKIGILKLLLEDVDIYFLDEPTNDLDIDTLEWLENFINKTEKPIIYVSHDETLLSRTANIILHLEQIEDKTECRHTIMKTDYNSYVETRLNAIRRQTQIANAEHREHKKKEEKLRQIMQKVEYKQNTISRNNPFGAKILKKKMHTLKSQESRLNSQVLTEKPDIEEGINFFFESVSIPKSKKILELNIPELKIQNRTLSKNINLEIVGNVHICIIGKNGVGKTTLLKIIYEKLKERTDIKVGYMPQNYEDILSHYTNVLDFIKEGNSKEEITKVRTYLGSMNFTADETTGKIESLSNGSKAKLFLAKLVVDKCDVLILDEPTRNLSPLSNPILRQVLKNFKGTIISVSHDRKYIEEVAEEVYVMTEEGITKKNG